MIVGGDAPSRQAVVEAINEWSSNVNGLQFTQVSDKNSADIIVNFQNGGASGSSGGGSDKDSNAPRRFSPRLTSHTFALRNEKVLYNLLA
jgi:hypothetical protein